MQRFYFHIHTSDLGVIPDTDGILLNDLSTAHQRAVRIMYQTMAAVDGPEDWRNWRVRIEDANGDARLTLLYQNHVARPAPSRYLVRAWNSRDVGRSE
jgi:hypothetical protein